MSRATDTDVIAERHRRRDTPAVDAITPSALVARLKEVYGVTTDADLAWKLKTSERKIQRWKGNSGPNFWATVDLLNRAGWLRFSTDVPLPASLREAERYAEQMRVAAARLGASSPPAQEKDAK